MNKPHFLVDLQWQTVGFVYFNRPKPLQLSLTPRVPIVDYQKA